MLFLLKIDIYKEKRIVHKKLLHLWLTIFKIVETIRQTTT